VSQLDNFLTCNQPILGLGEVSLLTIDLGQRTWNCSRPQGDREWLIPEKYLVPQFLFKPEDIYHSENDRK
jgi:hypothetical protein